MTRLLSAIPLLSTLAWGQTENIVDVGYWAPSNNATLAPGMWGYVDGGREYALFTTQSPGGVIAVDITDPVNPREKGFVSSPNSIWQEVRNFRNTAYKISQQGTVGLQIVNLDSLAAGNENALLGNMA